MLTMTSLDAHNHFRALIDSLQRESVFSFLRGRPVVSSASRNTAISFLQLLNKPNTSL